ncbi:MAG: chromosome segregation protein SMC [Gammaproteobacteria bacterium]|nr:chromosome segregation protein SMC [Gammaproteobacteria bacterium]
MRLNKIKLSGFKSFVDPVSIPIQGNLVAIVGPNGCGKSNIIDAISWVMGESSAKYLRGESLIDVIFNGSTTRKPVGQASVELVFDNQDGTIGGEYASYAEISIRRSINRNAESSWYLNGARCRRRDILDIFMGTGLGPRSYSIIGQNMISRIIEAKPEEMRTYLEEAAGISRYRERRRETENRIQHTRENMARLDDIRTELDQQLSTLKRQAEAAEKYKILKRQERAFRASALAAQWRQLDSKRVDLSLQIQQQETGLEAKQTEALEVSLAIDNMRESARESTEAFQEVQRRFYAAGNEITRIEQDIHHTQEKERMWRADLEQATRDCQDAEKSLSETEAALVVLSEELATLEPEQQAARDKLAAIRSVYQTADTAMQAWQQQWDTLSQQLSQSSEMARVEQTRVTLLEQKISQLTAREAVLAQEQTQSNAVELEKELSELSVSSNQFEQHMQAQQNELTALRENLSATNKTLQDKTRQLDGVRQELQQLHGRRSSLEALQQTALGQRDNHIVDWLKQQHLQDQPRLAAGVKVAKGWENAVEKVLGIYLQAVCVDDVSAFKDQLMQFKEGTLCLFTKSSETAKSSIQAETLLSKITTDWQLDGLLAGVYIAEDLDQAIALSKKLAAHESIITREGIWIGPSWLKVLRENNPAAGVFQREQELAALAIQCNELSKSQQSLETEIAECRTQIESLEKSRDALQVQLNETTSEASRVRTQQKMQQQRLTEWRERIARVTQEQADTSKQLTDMREEHTTARATWQQAMQNLESLTKQRDQLSEERDRLRASVSESRQAVEEAREKLHQFELTFQSAQAKYTSHQQSLERMKTRKATYIERKALLEGEADNLSSLSELDAELKNALTERIKIEEELNARRATNDVIALELRELEVKRHECDEATEKVRAALNTLRLEGEGLRVRADGVIQQLEEIQMHIETVLAELPEEEVNPQTYQDQYEQVVRRISRLGPINLIAIEEYATCSERKQFLDRQYTDLQSGLSTLENAIAKIDRETRTRFRETFDKVNGRFQELFPTVFGGGRAYLELTSDNLLETGITVMACPPGKRNSTIHLLSGGEKALTAIALVFSIFYLNPAPFCLLDEVDAPLDDANIGRFCDLVKTMAEKTQFIFISHNKLAINMGEQLMGVTMGEPGVSRLVSVNVEEAVSLAGT